MSDVLDFRYAERKDGGLILKFIKDLAKYEKMENRYKCNASVMHIYVNGMWK